MNDMNPRLAPFFTDLDTTAIGEYLVSSAFEGVIASLNLAGDWNRFYEGVEKSQSAAYVGTRHKTVSSEMTLKVMLQFLFSDDKDFFGRVLYKILKDFLLKIKGEDIYSLPMTDILADLRMLDFPETFLSRLKASYNIKVMLNKQKKKVEDKEPSKSSQNENNESTVEINTKTKAWKKKIAKARIEEVIDEMTDFVIDAELSDLEKQVINLSGRWHSLQIEINKNTIDLNERNKETSKINDALLDIIGQLRATSTG